MNWKYYLYQLLGLSRQKTVEDHIENIISLVRWVTIACIYLGNTKVEIPRNTKINASSTVEFTDLHLNRVLEPCNISLNISYKTRLNRQQNCWSLRCSLSIACRRFAKYIFILDFAPGFNGLDKDNYETRWETFRFWNLVHLILWIWR